MTVHLENAARTLEQLLEAREPDHIVTVRPVRSQTKGPFTVPGEHPAEPIRWRSPVALGVMFMVYGSGEGFKVILTMRERERQIRRTRTLIWTGRPTMDEAPDGWPHDFVATADHEAAMAEQNAAWKARIEKKVAHNTSRAVESGSDGDAATAAESYAAAEELRSLLEEVEHGE